MARGDLHLLLLLLLLTGDLWTGLVGLVLPSDLGVVLMMLHWSHIQSRAGWAAFVFWHLVTGDRSSVSIMYRTNNTETWHVPLFLSWWS